MEVVIGGLMLLLGLVGLWGYRQKRGREGDRRDMLRAADARERMVREKNIPERRILQADARKDDQQAQGALSRADVAREGTGDARDEATRIAGKYPRVPAVLLFIGILGAYLGPNYAAEPPTCNPPDVTGIVAYLSDADFRIVSTRAEMVTPEEQARRDGLLKNAAGLIKALHTMAAGSCTEAGELRDSLARMTASRNRNARIAAIEGEDARVALEALDTYRAEVPRLTARRWGWTVGIGAGLTLAPADAEEAADVAAFAGAMWGCRVGR